ncbi:hypothetical protein [Azotobacter vinelandii]
MSYVEVTKEQFFRAVGGPENINPTSFENFSEWKNLSTHEVVGRSEPGWKGRSCTAARYWLTERFANRKLSGGDA